MLSDQDRSSLIKAADAAADAAAAITLAYFRSDRLGTENKSGSGFDPVTVADREAELAMRRAISEIRPDDAILGEEYGLSEGTSGLTWVLDPIDGTRGFMSGTPTWGTLIAVSDGSGPIYGVVDQPYTKERFSGGFGKAALSHDQNVRDIFVRPSSALSDAVLFSTFPEVGSQSEMLAFQRVAAKAKLTRYGMDCYAYALLAAGTIDLVIEAGLFSYDIQAPIALIEAAGGVVTNWEGGPAHEGGRILAAASLNLHREALELLG